ncbi:MAG: lysophospholipid acyltransferase family protein [Verrucomicrobiae bacterium]|nr:lysophospholipid acyltransferase family protein [Verrucomicrobiae bacterium]
MSVTSRLLYFSIRALAATLRYTVEDQSGRVGVRERPATLFAIWHNRLGLMPYLYQRLIGRRDLAILVSPSRDGNYLADIIQQFGFTPVRGSSSQRGQQGLLEIARLVQKGYDAGWGVDGPRGPRGVAKPGMIKLASLTGAPIVPVSLTVSPCKRLNSWDRFILPLPFARCTVRLGKPVEVPADADDATTEERRLALEQALNELSGGAP